MRAVLRTVSSSFLVRDLEILKHRQTDPCVNWAQRTYQTIVSGRAHCISTALTQPVVGGNGCGVSNDSNLKAAEYKQRLTKRGVMLD